MRHFSRSLMVGLSFLALAACSPTVTQGPNLFPQDSSDLKADPNVHYGVLENGMRYAVMHNATPSGTATLLMGVSTGSLNETDDERGIAHFLEHMAFNGSENIPEGEMIKRLEKFGLAFGADTNASTGFTDTTYQLELPEVNEDILNETLMIMRETAGRLTLDPDAIERERGVILAEKRARENPAFRSQIASLKFYLDGTPFPDRLPIGTEDTIKSFTAEQFKAFYQGYYRPEDTFIVLVGDLEPDYAADKIAEYFADWTPVGTDRDDVEPGVLDPKGLKIGYHVDPEIRTSVTLNVMGKPDLRDDSVANRRDRFIQGLGNSILSRRLTALAQTPDAVFVSGSARMSTVFDVVSVAGLTLSCEPDKWDETLTLAEQELRRAYDYGFSQAELDEQIANTRSGLQVAVQTAPTRRTPGLARRIMNNFVGDSVFTTPQDNLEQFEAYVTDITPAMVHEAFKTQWAGYDNPQIFLSTSTVLETPEAEIEAVLRASQAEAVEAPAVKETAVFAYTDFGTPGEPAERKEIEDIGITTVRFANNVKLNIKKTPYQKDVVNVSVAYGGGNFSIPAGQEGLRWFGPNVLGSGGLEAHSADEINTIMAGKTVGVSFSTGADRSYMRGSTVNKDLPDQLNLMAAYMSAPGFRPEAKARYDKFISSWYPTLDSTPGGVAARDIDRLLRSGDARFGIPDESVLTGVDTQTLIDWVAPQNAESAIEVGVVGDVDIDRIIKEVGRTFGALPTRKADNPTFDPAVSKLSFPAGKKRPTVLSHSGDAGTGLLRVYWPAPDGRDAATSRQVSTLMGLFRLRLVETLREELGATYSPGALNFQPRSYPGYGYVGASVEVDPKDIDTVEARIKALGAQFRAGNFDQELFDRAVTPVLENIESSLENNSYWMGVVGEAQTDRERLERHRSRDSFYKSMTVEDLKPLAATLFGSDEAVSYHVLPQK